jgi:hypothetical protein
MLQNGGMELVRQFVDSRREFLGLLREFGDLSVRGRHIGGHIFANLRKADQEERESLANVVVQLLTKKSALGFLSLDESGGEALQFRVALL